MAHAEPAISIVTATYNRSRALACAIESARRQTFADWEMIIVGDACTDDTPEVISRVGDSRIRFINLESNFGGQAGPNNIGVAEARAPLVAFLNHDDLWLPNHLKSCRETMLAVRADLVFGIAATIAPQSPLPLQFDTLQLKLGGLGPGNQYSPAEMDAQIVPASCWLVRRNVLLELGGFPPESDCIIPPSQVILFRAWRAGYRMHGLNYVTLVIVESGNRVGSYTRPSEPEQEWVLAQLGNPWFATEIAALAPEANRQWPLGRPSWPMRRLALALARLGINPRELYFRLCKGLGKGDRVAQFRRIGGLPVFTETEDPGSMLRLAMVRQSCRVEIGARIHFGAGKGGARFLAAGWSRPEKDWVWSDGPTAELLFDFGHRVGKDLVFTFSLRPFPGGEHAPQAVEVWAGDKALLETWTLGPAHSGQCRLHLPATMMAGFLARICFRFLNPFSPRSLGLSSDPRELAICLLDVQIDVIG